MTEEILTPFDAAEYLDTPERIAAYLEVALEEAGDDPVVIAQALGTIGRARGLSDLARETGLTRQALAKAFGANGNPRLSTLVAMLKAVGLRLSVEARAAA